MVRGCEARAFLIMGGAYGAAARPALMQIKKQRKKPTILGVLLIRFHTRSTIAKTMTRRHMPWTRVEFEYQFQPLYLHVIGAVDSHQLDRGGIGTRNPALELPRASRNRYSSQGARRHLRVAMSLGKSFTIT